MAVASGLARFHQPFIRARQGRGPERSPAHEGIRRWGRHLRNGPVPRVDPGGIPSGARRAMTENGLCYLRSDALMRFCYSRVPAPRRHRVAVRLPGDNRSLTREVTIMLRALLATTLILLAAMPPVAIAQEAKLPATLAWTAYDVGSSGYNQAVAIGAAFKNKYGANLRILPGKNDISRLLPLKEDKVQISLNGIGSLFANEGVFEFGTRSWGPQGVRMLAVSAADSLTTLVTAKDANIVTPADLKGKRVFWVVGAPALNQNLTAVLAFAGLEWKDVQKVEFGGFAQAMQGIIQNQVDAGFAQTTTGHLYQLASSPRGIHYPAFPHKDKAGWERLRKVAPYFMPAFGTEGAGMSKDKRVEGVNYPYPAMIAYERVSEDLVYNTTKAMFEDRKS